MPESDNGLPSEEDFEVLGEFASEIRASKARQESVSSQELDDAIAVTTDYLRTGWGTGGGRRLRQFVWSLWNGWHLINLCELSHGLDGRLTDAVIVLFRAAMVDILTEDQKRRILTDSGEIQRWEECQQETPKDETVLYPPLVWSAEELARLAASARGVERRRAARIQEELSRLSE